ncbi:MAG: cupin domain-containing protein [Candidatus Bathyarchaeia archaeon]
MGTIKSQNNSSYPEVIRRLPEAEVEFQGTKAWIMQGNLSQIVFFEFEAEIDMPEHSHSYPQWGIVIEGKMELKIEGKPRICQKGDEYLIPAQAKHCAKFLSRSRVMDFFSEKARYKSKQT